VKPENRGKTPGIRKENGDWVGLVGKWAEKLFPNAKKLQEWMKMGAYIGTQARVFNCADVDANDASITDALVEIVVGICGLAPARHREGAPRLALMYRVEDGVVIRKWRIAFIDAEGREHAFEWLGYGQYWNVEGLHPSGEPYKWNDPHPCEIGADNIPTVSAEKVAQVRNAILEYIDVMGFTLKASSGSGAGGSAEAKKIGAGDVAPSSSLVLDVLAAVPCDDETFPMRDEFVNVLRSIKASLGSSHQEHWPRVLEWTLTYPGAESDYIEKIWESFDDSALGWGFLSGWARGHGFTGDAQHDFDDNRSQPVSAPAENRTGAELPKIEGPETPLERALKRCIYCVALDRFYDTETHELISKDGFNTKNTGVADYGSSGKNSAAAEFLNTEGARKVDTATYRVGGPLIVKEGAKTALNLWRPSDFKPWPGPSVTTTSTSGSITCS
jgi:hypothetical protein